MINHKGIIISFRAIFPFQGLLWARLLCALDERGKTSLNLQNEEKTSSQAPTYTHGNLISNLSLFTEIRRALPGRANAVGPRKICLAEPERQLIVL